MNSILIVGHARHGKDTVAEILRDSYGYTFESSSHACLRIFIYELLKDKYGYTTLEECFQDRVNHRAEWKQLITMYNTPDKTRLARAIIKDNDIYVGMRCEDELAACDLIGLFDYVIWVDADKRKPPESEESMTIKLDDSMYVVDNNGTEDDLIKQVEKLVRFMKVDNILEGL